MKKRVQDPVLRISYFVQWHVQKQKIRQWCNTEKGNKFNWVMQSTASGYYWSWTIGDCLLTSIQIMVPCAYTSFEVSQPFCLKPCSFLESQLSSFPCLKWTWIWSRWTRNEDCHRAQTACQTMTSPPMEDKELGETGTKEATPSVTPQFTELCSH